MESKMNEWKVYIRKKDFRRQRRRMRKKILPFLCDCACMRRRKAVNIRMLFVIDTLEHFILPISEQREQQLDEWARPICTSIPIWTIDKIQSIFLEHNFASDAAYILVSDWKKNILWRIKRERKYVGFLYSFVRSLLSPCTEQSSFVRGQREKVQKHEARPWVLKYLSSFLSTAIWKKKRSNTATNPADSSENETYTHLTEYTPRANRTENKKKNE